MTSQAHEALRAAIADWRAASGPYRLVCARWGLRCFAAWRFHRRTEGELFAAMCRAAAARHRRAAA